jgi:hypothetical protein
MPARILAFAEPPPPPSPTNRGDACAVPALSVANLFLHAHELQT